MNEKLFNLRTVIQLLTGLPLHHRIDPMAELAQHVLEIPRENIIWQSLVLLQSMLMDAIITQHPTLLSAVTYCRSRNIDLDNVVDVEMVFEHARKMWGLDFVPVVPLRNMSPSMRTHIVWQ